MRKFPAGLVPMALLACGSPAPAARPVGSEFIEVEYPPPPARIEELTEKLPGRPDCTWIDGHYAWLGRRWEWVPGLWVVPPPSCARAPATLTWMRRDPPQLYYTPPYWYPTDATSPVKARTCPPPIPCQNQPPSGS